jgi:predicted TIM-barrel fold metal-dependent hydrolase
MARIGLRRVVVVQPSIYGADNRCIIGAVAQFGEAARAVFVVTPATAEPEIARLHAAGARDACFFMVEGAPVTGPPGYANVAAIARAAIGAAPERVARACDWPHPNPPADLPDEAALLA